MRLKPTDDSPVTLRTIDSLRTHGAIVRRCGGTLGGALALAEVLFALCTLPDTWEVYVTEGWNSAT